MQIILFIVVICLALFIGYIFGNITCAIHVRDRFTKIQPLMNTILTDILWACIKEGMTKEQMKQKMEEELDFFKIAMEQTKES